MKTSLTMHRYVYTLFLILSSQSIFNSSFTSRSSRSDDSSSRSSRDDDNVSYEYARSSSHEDTRRESYSSSYSSARASVDDDEDDQKRDRYDEDCREQEARDKSDQEWRDRRDWEERRSGPIEEDTREVRLAQAHRKLAVSKEKYAAANLELENYLANETRLENTALKARREASIAKEDFARFILEHVNSLEEASSYLADEIQNYWETPERLKPADRTKRPINTSARKSIVVGGVEILFEDILSYCREKGEGCIPLEGLRDLVVKERQKRSIPKDTGYQRYMQQDVEPEFEIVHQEPVFRRKHINPEDRSTIFSRVIEKLRDRSPQDDEFEEALKEKEGDAITVFIPTREYYEQNREMFSVPLECNGYPVFIPEKLKKPKTTIEQIPTLKKEMFVENMF